MREYKSMDFNSRKRESEPSPGSKQRKSRDSRKQFIDHKADLNGQTAHQREFINKNDPVKKGFITPDKVFSDDSDPAEHLDELEKTKAETFESITVPKNDIGTYRRPKGHYEKKIVNGVEVSTWVPDKKEKQEK